MPKSHVRYKHVGIRGSFCPGDGPVQSGLIRRDLLLSIPPRKVSFEDSRNDSNQSIRSDDTVPTKNNKKTASTEIIENEKITLRRKRSLLVRPITSLSLVDLAKSVAHDDVSSIHQVERRESKRACSLSLSPRSVVDTPELPDENQQHLSSSQQTCEGPSKSPWGHFIDMTTDENDYDKLPTTGYPNHEDFKSNLRRATRGSRDELLCRTRRRPSPYGEYRSYTSRGKQPILSFIGLRSDSRGSFRLSPRNKIRNQESADELIDIFSELQVEHVQQKTIR